MAHIVIHIEIQGGRVDFKAQADGRPLTRFEMAHELTKITGGLIRDGIRESGQKIIEAPPTYISG